MEKISNVQPPTDQSYLGASNKSTKITRDTELVQNDPNPSRYERKLLDLPNELLRKISTYCSRSDIHNLRHTNKCLSSIAEEELEFREWKSSEKFIASYCCFEGIDGLEPKELVEAIETLTGESLPIEVKENNQEACIAFAKAFTDLPKRIAATGAPSIKNGRISSKNIHGIPPHHTVSIMLPKLLVTYDGTNSYIFKLENSREVEGAIEATPCVGYGESGEYIHQGACLGVAKNTKIIVLYADEKMKILSFGAETSFDCDDARRDDWIFYQPTKKCKISPDGKSVILFSLFEEESHLAQAFSDTPHLTDSFSLEAFSFSNHDGSVDLTIYDMAESIDHTWSMFLDCHKTGAELDGQVAQNDYESGLKIPDTVSLPNNTIAVAWAKKIVIHSSDGKAQAVCKIPDYEISKIQISPDGRTLAVLLKRSANAGVCAIALYQIPPVNTSTMSEQASTSGDANPPELVHLWNMPLDAANYIIMFIDYGTKLAILNCNNPRQMNIAQLT